MGLHVQTWEAAIQPSGRSTSNSSSMFLITIMSQSRRTIRYGRYSSEILQSQKGAYLEFYQTECPVSGESCHQTKEQGNPAYLSLVRTSANRSSRWERLGVFGSGRSKSTVITSNPCLTNASFVSEGKFGVDIMTRGYLDPTNLRLSFSTRVPGKYEFFVRSVT